MRKFLATALLAVLGLMQAGQAAALTTPAHYSALVIFGDSLSDSGNNALLVGPDPAQLISSNRYFATRPYASGSYSNGPVWASYFAAGLGLDATPSLLGGGNHAFGGAETSQPGPLPGGFPFSLQMQLGSYLGAHGLSADPNALYIVEGGGNNLRAGMDLILSGADPATTMNTAALQYAQDIGTIVDQLQAAGARHIVVWNTPNFGLTPFAASYGPQGATLGTSFAAVMNGALQQRMALEGSDVRQFDVYGLLSQIVANPAAYGLSNVNDACGNPALACDLATALFYDGIHPTALGHQMLGSAMLAAVPEPASAALLLPGLLLIAWLQRRRAR